MKQHHHLRTIEFFLHNTKLHLRFQEIVHTRMAICFTNNKQVNKYIPTGRAPHLLYLTLD